MPPDTHFARIEHFESCRWLVKCCLWVNAEIDKCLTFHCGTVFDWSHCNINLYFCATFVFVAFVFLHFSCHANLGCQPVNSQHRQHTPPRLECNECTRARHAHLNTEVVKLLRHNVTSDRGGPLHRLGGESFPSAIARAQSQKTVCVFVCSFAVYTLFVDVVRWPLDVTADSTYITKHCKSYTELFQNSRRLGAIRCDRSRVPDGKVRGFGCICKWGKQIHAVSTNTCGTFASAKFGCNFPC